MTTTPEPDEQQQQLQDAVKRFDMSRKMNRCPVCNAAPGENCVSQGAGEVRWVHHSRYSNSDRAKMLRAAKGY